MPKVNHNITSKQRRVLRVRSKMHGTAKKPRLSVFRSNKHVFLQAIDDDKGTTLLAIADGIAAEKGKTKAGRAVAAAKVFAEKAKAAGIKEMVFDRGANKYHGRVKAVAEAIRESGMKV